jgi:hypothetical protein
MTDHVHGFRVTRAVLLLRATNASVKSIAFDCGFGGPAQLDRRFHAWLGMTPSSFRLAVPPGVTRLRPCVALPSILRIPTLASIVDEYRLDYGEALAVYADLPVGRTAFALIPELRQSRH